MCISTQTLSKVIFSDSSLIGQSVEVGGWLTSARMGKKVGFLVLVDGSSLTPLQVVVSLELMEKDPILRTLGAGFSVRVWGQVVASCGAGQAVEIKAERVEVVGGVQDRETYPIQPKAHSTEFLRSLPHLRPRVTQFGAIARLRHTLSQAIHQYLSQYGFLWVATPILSTADAEGAGQQFQVVTQDGPTEFFGKEVFLTVSGQLDVEAYCMALSRVYTFGPTFRAELSQTSRHLADFWMIEPEMAFATLDDIVHLAEGLLKHVVEVCLRDLPQEMAYFESQGGRSVASWQQFTQDPFEKMTYTEAVRILIESGQSFEYPIFWGVDLQSEHEKFLVEKVGRPVVLTDYPTDIKAFYMKQSVDGKTVAAMDILVPGMGEIVGGSQREEGLEQLDARMKAGGMDLEAYQAYRDLRRYGSVPHAGFGLGFERLVSYLAGLSSVKDAIAYPRSYKSI